MILDWNRTSPYDKYIEKILNGEMSIGDAINTYPIAPVNLVHQFFINLHQAMVDRFKTRERRSKMTWKEFKTSVEAGGVQDDDELVYIDMSGDYAVSVTREAQTVGDGFWFWVE